ncbi:bifunctional UDP-N-acetylglucosamine diphosphorylase/glucosamine-1-phosphate N-acetyltransferase GlmU [bacterium]|nr:bifunctional UDP-N-acetylglucosamine diphosphorylase/glucosamine-1-phosphate N-acetyltransferase GlmU [bacterium]
MEKDLAVIVLAAGKGTRMKSDLPKVLHQLCGRSMIGYVLHAIHKLGSKKNFLVVGHKKEQVKEKIKRELPFFSDKFTFVVQRELLGSGHAVLQTEKNLKNFKGYVLIISGDIPLIEKETLIRLVNCHKKEKNAATILTTQIEVPFSYGRIIRNKDNEVEGIIEEKEASVSEKKIKEINSGIYCFSSGFLFDSLRSIRCTNKKGEYYLTDVIKILKEKGKKIGACKIEDKKQVIGINNRISLACVQRIIQQKILENLMLKGVTIINPQETYIEDSVEIGKDTVVFPGVNIQGNTRIGKNCYIGPYTIIKDSYLENSIKVQISVLEKAKISSKTIIQPFSYIKG